ncbi:hypothetical protein [Streptoalloteichus hindustanus]|uniref:Uncharacterized protein n=1 Tax=Streptoalloteichus hindustanus TaxID=2017 RepID=A0A1M5MCI4_STRHI|nr:hypothetical protein [Streptoalloteichus hindustanus]SHG74977.1 hypothetical protein SAMN05444320_11371 [Streptoalloteichus hindustanus]
MNDLPDHVAPERFHHCALTAGIPPISLPCGDPACDAQPGQPCSPFRAHGDAQPVSRAQLRRVRAGGYAVRTCPRCQGSGHDPCDPTRSPCRCAVDGVEALNLRALDLIHRILRAPDPEEETRLRTQAHRCLAHAVAAALRAHGVSALVRSYGPTGYVLRLDTPHGPVTVAVSNRRPRWDDAVATARAVLATLLGRIATSH